MPERGNALSSKTVHAPRLSSLDTYMETSWLVRHFDAKAIHAGLGYGNLPQAAGRAGSIELTM